MSTTTLVRNAIAGVATLVAAGAGLATDASAQSDSTTRISNAMTGGAGSSAAGNAASSLATIAADGGTIAFISRASDLVPNDTNGRDDVFVYVRATGRIERVSVASDGSQANGSSYSPAISADGRFVAFTSDASNLAYDPNGHRHFDIFRHDRLTRTTIRVSFSHTGGGANEHCVAPSISGNGDRITYLSRATNIVRLPWWFPVDEVYVYDVSRGVTAVASADASGVAADWHCYVARLSGDGRSAYFHSYGSNLPHGSTWGPALYVKDLSTGAIERVDVDSTGTQLGSLSWPTAISDDAQRCLFYAYSPLSPGDTNGTYDVYLRDRAAGTTVRASVGSGGAEIPTWSVGSGMSDDGRFVAFTTAEALDDDDRNGVSDVYVHDFLANSTMRVSRGTLDEEGATDSWLPPQSAESSLSADGRIVLFTSASTDFAPNDTNGADDLFLRERAFLPASSSHYGAGFPGRNGVVPTLTPSDPPRRAAPVSLDASNSSGLYTVAFLVAGITRNSIPTGLGGTLLLDPLVWLAFPLAPAGGALPCVLPANGWANGLAIDLQLLELDPFAAKGVSFTDGLELLLGDG